MALTGNQKAYTFALSNVARSGATRSGYVSGSVFVSVGGALQRVQIDSLEIVDELNETPNTCRFRIIGPTSITNGMPVVIRLGSKNNSTFLFAGHVLTTSQSYWAKPDNVRTDVSCVDYTWHFGFYLVTKRYASQSATAIVQDLIANYATLNNFGALYVAAGLPTIPEITFTNENLGEALSRTAQRIGAYWYVDYYRNVHFFFTDPGPGPAALVPTHPSLADVRADRDRSQTLSRVAVEGRGTKLLAAVAAGDTILPVEAVDMFAVASDVYLKASFQGSEGGAQHLSFTGVQLGGGGAIIGPGVAPAAALLAALAPGTGIEPGAHSYAYTWATALGESAPSPLATITVTGNEPAPTVPPTFSLAVGAGLSAGYYYYATTFTNASGETLIGSATPAPILTGDVADPTVTPTVTLDSGGGSGNIGTPGQTIEIAYCYSGYSAQLDYRTGRSPSRTITQQGTAGQPGLPKPVNITMTNSTNPYVYYLEVHLREQGDSTWYRIWSTANNPAGGTTTIRIANVGYSTPIPAGFPLRQVALTIPLGGPGITGRKVYRTLANALTFFVCRTVADNTTGSITDTLSDAGLGAGAPVVGTAVNARTALSGIAVGPSGVTSRKVYRTAAGLSTLKLQQTLANNTATTSTDSTPDGSLGATAPTGDTSGITQPIGQVAPGATTMPVASTAFAQSAGGWALVNGSQLIRYGGVSLGSLVGIPAWGRGSITAVIPYNSSIVAPPLLTGIPASGGRSVQRAMSEGDEIYLVVQVDDEARRAQLEGWMGGTGVREEWVQDRRLSIPEARARGQATLTERVLDQVRVSYTCRDLFTRSGKDITVNLPLPTNLVGTFKIQHVVINNFRPHPEQQPTFTVQASSARFSFEDLLRLVTRDVAR